MTSPDTPAVARRRQRLKEWIDAKFDGKQAAFNAATGSNQGEISSLLKNKSFGEKKARALEELAGMPHGYLDTADYGPKDIELKPISSLDATKGHILPSQRQKVRVEGMATMDEQGFWQSGNREVELWSVNTDDPRAFAIRVLSQHFDPVVSPGQCLLVSPSVDVRIGRWVLIVLKDGRQSFRTYRGHDYGVWHFSSVNDRASYLDLTDDEVADVFAITLVAWTD